MTADPVPAPAFAEQSETLQLYRCKVCGTRWFLWPNRIHRGGWNLIDHHQRPGACCDNVGMGDQVEHLRDIPLTTLAALTLEPVRPTPPLLLQEIIDAAIDEPTDEIRDAIRDADLEAMRLLAEARAEVTRLTAELARMDELANKRGNEVIRLRKALAAVEGLLPHLPPEDRR